jgi:hypothetical protein
LALVLVQVLGQGLAWVWWSLGLGWRLLVQVWAVQALVPQEHCREALS